MFCPKPLKLSSWGFWLSGRTTDTRLALKFLSVSTQELFGITRMATGWVPDLHAYSRQRMRVSERLPFIHSFPALCQHELLWEPPHPSCWKGAMPGMSLPLILLAQTLWGCSQLPERKVRLGEIHRGPWKTLSPRQQCQVHLWQPRQGSHLIHVCTEASSGGQRP